MIPEPRYTLIETTLGNDPAVVVVNSSLRYFRERAAFAWHLRIVIDCESTSAYGMPTVEEAGVLRRFEEDLAPRLQAADNAIFLARITARGERVLLFRIKDADAANGALHAPASQDAPVREWDFHLRHDPEWALAQPELKLVERAASLS